MADADLEPEDVDPLEEALRENAKLKAENIRLKKGKPTEKDDELKKKEREAKISGLQLRVVENNKKLRELEHPHKHSWWESKTERLEEKTKYVKAKHEYNELHPSSFARNVIIGMVVTILAAIVLAVAFDDNTGPVLEEFQASVNVLITWTGALLIIALLVVMVRQTAGGKKNPKAGGGGGGHH